MPDIEVKYKLHETALEGVMGGQEAPIQVEVSGENLDILARITKELQARIEGLPSVYNVRTSFQGGQPEVDLAIRDEVAAAFGLTTQTISRTLERQLSGEVAGELSKDQRTRDIRVKYRDIDLRELHTMQIEGTDGAILTLGDIAELNIIEGPREILREDQRRVGRITGYLTEGRILSEAVADVRATMQEVVVPSGYRIEIGGEERERAASFESLKFALLLSIVLVYMVMASLFESTLHPFTVMFSVPLSRRRRDSWILFFGRTAQCDGLYRHHYARRYCGQRCDHSRGSHQPTPASWLDAARSNSPGRAGPLAPHYDDQCHDHSRSATHGTRLWRGGKIARAHGDCRHCRPGDIHIDDLTRNTHHV